MYKSARPNNPRILQCRLYSCQRCNGLMRGQAEFGILLMIYTAVIVASTYH
ncbi:hypothetical protein Plhal304r1_c017g0061091 [Plasmopara halstedii]